MKKDEVQESTRGQRRAIEGVVASAKMNKSVVVSVEVAKKHRRYGKYVKRTKRYMAHDERNECQVGDRVLIVESRPLSKRKRWRVRSVVERAA